MSAIQSSLPESVFTGRDSIFATRAKVFELLQDGIVDTSSVNLILQTGSKHDEPEFWDFKESLPWSPLGIKIPDGLKAENDSKIDEIAKDCVAFYNSFGGYLIAGVTDKDRHLVGFDKDFDVDSLNHRLYGVTGQNINCVYRRIDFTPISGNTVCLGLLFIPRRSAQLLPAQFKSDARQSKNGSPPCFRRGDFYMRQSDECRPARTPEDFAFLYSDERRKILPTTVHKTALLENNLPDRDGELGQFIGREADMTALWQWLSDPFSPVRLICGLGGVGKTSLAYHFSELFVYVRPPQFEKLVWLGAKLQNWQASRDGYITLQRVDFFDVDGFLRKLIVELGCPDKIVDDASEREDLIRLAVEHLNLCRTLVIIDDVDTLEDDDQQTLYHIVSLIFTRADSKALMTARRNLGMPRDQYVELKGIERSRFFEFLVSKSSLLKISCPFQEDSDQVSELFDMSSGSPLFVVSILRLISLATPYKDAVKEWGGAAGEKVRDAAFFKEVSRLKVVEARILLAAVYLRETSSVELSSVLQLSAFDVRKGLDSLRDFSMISIASDLPGGATIDLSPNSPPKFRRVRRLISGATRRAFPACFSQQIRPAGRSRDRNVGGGGYSRPSRLGSARGRHEATRTAPR